MIDWLASAITGHLCLLLLTRLVGVMAGYCFPCLYISSWRSKGVVDVWQNSAILGVSTRRVVKLIQKQLLNEVTTKSFDPY